MQSEKIGKINQTNGAFKGCQSFEIYTGTESVPYIDDPFAEEGGPGKSAAEWFEQFESLAAGTCGWGKVKKIVEKIFI